MSENVRCGCIGCGGIGSYFAQHIDRLIDLKQLNNFSFTFFDDDIVETKNILYQNFDSSDIDSNKTSALELRYFNLKFVNKRCGLEDLKNYNLVILCADNNIIRNYAWQNYINNNIPFIDSRANGKVIGIFSNETKDYLKTIDNSTDSQSCQNPFQLVKKEIEYGNVIIASILSQCLLNYKRKNKLPNDFLISF